MTIVSDTALIPYQFTIDSAVAEWLAQKKTRTGSGKTVKAYRETMLSFRMTLSRGNLDLLDSPIDVTRVATIWAGVRLPARLKKDGTPVNRFHGEVAAATYNHRLSIIASWYSFVQEVYKLDIPNPVDAKSVKRRPVQEYATVLPIEPEEVEEGLDQIDRSTLQGLRDYAILAIALATGRRASELVGLRAGNVQIIGSNGNARIRLFFHCKGGKLKRDLLDMETSAILLEYLYAQHGEQWHLEPPEAAVWVSYSRFNKGEAIGVKTLSNVCERYLGTTRVHRLRHTFSVGMLRSGAIITDLAEKLGHSSVAVTYRYTKELNSDENLYSEKLVKRFGMKRKGTGV